MGGDVDLRSNHRTMVLVYRPIHCAARARRSERNCCPSWFDLRVVPETVSGLPVHYPRSDLLRLGEERESPCARCDGRSGWQSNPVHCSRRIPYDGAVLATSWPTRSSCGWVVVCANGIARRSVQRMLDLIHRGPLRKMEAGSVTA